MTNSRMFRGACALLPFIVFVPLAPATPPDPTADAGLVLPLLHGPIALREGQPARSALRDHRPPHVQPYHRNKVFCSSRYRQFRVSTDKRPWIEPQLAAPLSSDDYVDNRDPAMDAIYRAIG